MTRRIGAYVALGIGGAFYLAACCGGAIFAALGG